MRSSGTQAPSGASAFRRALARRVLILDGAMGTTIQGLELDPRTDFRGLGPCCDLLNLTRPDVIRAIHDSFLAVGCDAVETNTFGAAPLALASYGLADETRAINLAGARIAREACRAHSTPEQPRFVLGSLGPGSKLPTLGQADAAAIEASYDVQARALVEGGVDALLVETCQDPLQMEAAIAACVRARETRDIPILVSFTVEVTGTLLVGTEVDEILARLEDSPAEVILLNCATGPREMEEHVQHLGEACTKPIGVYPNAGLPQIVDGAPHYPLTPGELADWLTRFVEEDGVRIVGGCCGTTPAHLAAVVDALEGRRAKIPPPAPGAAPGPLTHDFEQPTPPFLGPRTIDAIPLKSLLAYVNEATLFQFRWDERRKGRTAKEYDTFLKRELRPRFHALAERSARERILLPAASYGFWRCRPDGDELVLYRPDDGDRELARLSFPRQEGKRGLAIPDFFAHEDQPDVVALFVVTVGARAMEVAREWYAAGDTEDYEHLVGLAGEVTAAAAEYVHRQIRGELAIAADDARDLAGLLKQGYRGGRFELGCPAWPCETERGTVLDLLDVERLGIHAAPEGRLAPEPTTAAIVCHHPGAKYFTI